MNETIGNRKIELNKEQVFEAIGLFDRVLAKPTLINKRMAVMLQVRLYKIFRLSEEESYLQTEEQPYKTQSDVVIDMKLRENFEKLRQALAIFSGNEHTELEQSKLANWIRYISITTFNSAASPETLLKLETHIRRAEGIQYSEG